MEQKLAPASVIRQEVKNRVMEIEQRMGVKPGRKRLRDLKEEVTGERCRCGTIVPELRAAGAIPVGATDMDAYAENPQSSCPDCRY